MDLVETAVAQKTALVLRNVDVRVLGMLRDQARQDGRAAASLIEAAAVAPAKGAPEPGKGTVVDVVA